MPGPTVEELLKAGGTRRAPPTVGPGETFVNRAVNAIPGGRLVTDALSTAALELGSNGGERATLTPQAEAELKAMGEEVSTPEGLLERYRQVRDTRAERTELGSDQNPWAGRAGTALGIGLSALAPLPKFAGKGLVPTVKTGAGYGAFEGATNGSADLAGGDVVGAVGDTVKGALFGAGMGAGGYGLMRLGQKGVQALRGARQEVLAQETAAVREGAEEAQAAAAKAGEKERKMIGQAREMNKSRDARAARVASREQALLDRARRRGQPAGAPTPPEEPSTKVLEGMRGKAFERQQNRSDKALGYRRSMGDPDVDTQLASARQDFIDQAPEALSDPAALRRQYMERFLRQKYGDEMAERIMQERVGPGGEILPRRAPGGQAPSLGDEAEAAMAARRADAAPPPADRRTGVYKVPLSELDDVPAKAWNEGRARASREQFQRGSEPPPIKVVQGEDGLRELADGNHRLAVARELGLKELPVAFDSAEAAAVRANRQRGSSPFSDAVAPMDSRASASAPRPIDSPWMADAAPAIRQPPLTAPPVLRAGAGGMPYGRNLLPEAPPNMPSTRSMAAPKDAPLPTHAPASQPADTATAPMRPAARPPPEPVPVDDGTRVAGPADVGALASERAAARERGVLTERAWNLGESMPVVGPAVKATKEMLRDPALRARVLSIARLHLLERINPELFARVGGTLAAAAAQSPSRYRARKYLEMRLNPELRMAEQQAADEASRLTDEQLMGLIANGATPSP